MGAQTQAQVTWAFERFVALVYSVPRFFNPWKHTNSSDYDSFPRMNNGMVDTAYTLWVIHDTMEAFIEDIKQFSCYHLPSNLPPTQLQPCQN